MSNDVPEHGDYVARSAEIKDLASALCKAQSEMSAASKDRVNPHFKNQYATLASVWEACRGPLTGNGLSVVQLAGTEDVETILLHSSGQWLSARTPILADKTGRAASQAYGSAVTYARRYALSAMVGIVQDDDDGEASGQPEGKPEPTKSPRPPAMAEREPPTDVKTARFIINGNPTPELMEVAYRVLVEMTPFAELAALAAELQAAGLNASTLSRLREQYTARKARGR